LPPPAPPGGRPESKPAPWVARARTRPGWTRRPPQSRRPLGRSNLVNPRIGWGRPPSGSGQPQLPGWAPLVDPEPRTLQAARTLARWWWPTLTVTGFLAVITPLRPHPPPPPP